MTISRVALDLDDTLVSHIYPDNLHRIFLTWFKNNNLILQIDNEYYVIHPGAIELIRYLHQKPRLTYCFFSRAMYSRNKILVTLLLKRALCEKDYKYAMSAEEFEKFMAIMEENIFSNDDCPRTMRGGHHKDLQIVLGPHNHLDFTILLDDQIASVKHGQQANVLLISYADDDLFDATFDKHHYVGSHLRSVNHLFFAVYFIEIIFSHPTKTPAQALFEIQYQDTGVELEVNYDLRKNNNFYLNGLKLLQPFATSDLHFYGFEADQFFGLTQDLNKSQSMVAKFTQKVKYLYSATSSTVFKASESKTAPVLGSKPVKLPTLKIDKLNN